MFCGDKFSMTIPSSNAVLHNPSNNALTTWKQLAVVMMEVLLVMIVIGDGDGVMMVMV